MSKSSITVSKEFIETLKAECKKGESYEDKLREELEYFDPEEEED